MRAVGERGAGTQRSRDEHGFGEFSVGRASRDRRLTMQYGHCVVRATATAVSSLYFLGMTPSARAAASSTLTPAMASGASCPMGPTRLKCAISNITSFALGYRLIDRLLWQAFHNEVLPVTPAMIARAAASKAAIESSARPTSIAPSSPASTAAACERASASARIDPVA